MYNVADATTDQEAEQQPPYNDDQYSHQHYEPWNDNDTWHYEEQWYTDTQPQDYNQQLPTFQPAQAISSVKAEEYFVASITPTDLNTDATVALRVDSGAAVYTTSNCERYTITGKRLQPHTQRPQFSHYTRSTLYNSTHQEEPAFVHAPGNGTT